MFAEAIAQSSVFSHPLQPIVRELPADLDTPATAYLKLRGRGPSFLLESVEGGERVARYSFIGLRPRARYLLRGHTLTRETNGEARRLPIPRDRDFLHTLQSELAQYPPVARDGLPRFLGGLVGYLGFETLRHFEPVLDPRLHHPSLPDAVFLFTDTLVAFDHARSNLLLMTYDFDGDGAAAEARLDEIEALLRGPRPDLQSPITNHQFSVFQSNMARSDYEQMVQAAKEYIAAGDIFQVVLSQRFTRQTGAHPFNIYRAARRLNPSPYMFYFEFGEVDGEPVYLVGASPEMMTRLEGRRAALRPIAGTRPRGRTPAEDAALEQDLLADPKERAEHVMLVDLGRNDLGRVCEYGSIAVPDFFTVEHYSHVMHLVSHVTGRVRAGVTAFDLVRATFPAGTLSGAPKVRACEIIAELEPEARGPYGGAVGYFSFDGALDTCIAIRTAVVHGRTVSVQAGAGIVADSDPAREYEETVNKAKAMMKAVELAEGS
ncbi:MAG: anthranilate synthase component I [Anaerolineales bacterium]|nr:anthranilate synthase component I [Anaerolineales bacterium]